MPRKNLDAQIEIIKEELSDMTKLVDEQLKKAMKSLDGMDLKLAREVIEKDKKANELYVEIKERCIQTIALQQPVAGDLRFISISMDVASNLERIGDYSVDVAKNVDFILAEPEEISGKFKEEEENLMHADGVDLIQKMGSLAIKMVEMAGEIYINDDEKKINEVLKMEDEVDSLFGVIFKRLQKASRSDSAETTFILNLLLIARHLERIADHATNISNRTIYTRHVREEHV